VRATTSGEGRSGTGRGWAGGKSFTCALLGELHTRACLSLVAPPFPVYTLFMSRTPYLTSPHLTSLPQTVIRFERLRCPTMDMAMHDDVASDFDLLPLSIDGYLSTVAHAKRCIQELCARYHKDICDSAHLRCSRHFAELEFQQTSRPSQLTPTEESGMFRSSYGIIVGLRSGKTGESAWGGNGVSSNVS
jgi:hypothetical protein